MGRNRPNVRPRRMGRLKRTHYRLNSWRRRLPLGWRIVFDVVRAALYVLFFYLVIRMICMAILLLLPLLMLGGFGKGGGTQKEDDSEFDPRGNGPKPMAPDYWH